MTGQIERFERAIKFVQGVLDAGRTLTVKADGYVPAVWRPTSKCASDVEGLVSYFRQEFRMQDRNLREKGFASFFLIDTAAGNVMHFRVTSDLGRYSVHYLD